jgi:ribosomal-protein-alanine N-acetyltransferase
MLDRSKENRLSWAVLDGAAPPLEDLGALEHGKGDWEQTAEMVRAVPRIFPCVLDGQHIRVREVDLGDLEATWAWASRAEFFRFLPVDQPTREEERAWLEAIVADARQIPRRRYELGVEVVEASELVGMVRLAIESERHRNASVGYGIRPDCWGHGYATEAARLIVGFGFESLGMHRIWATHHPDNLASRKVLDRVGFKEEGRRRDDRVVGGAWHDSIVCSILENEWRKVRVHE